MAHTYGYYDSWKEQRQTCPHCSWQGRGQDAVSGEIYGTFGEKLCPRCGAIVFLLMWPTTEESRQNWDMLNDEEKRQVEAAETRDRDVAQRSLKGPEQLPELDGEQLVFGWDQQGHDTLITYDSQVLWREPVFYEGAERFAAVAEIVRQKYHGRVHDLVPSENSKLYLYGDRASSFTIVEQARRRLRENERKET